ncbi:MAG: hypothetical protein M9958_10780 [Chitinophagales bacterium]|nr:hypothetical protein [Chitinophagales bacterium]
MSKVFKHILIIIGAGLIIYWPLCFFIFGMKNDILTDYFPTRFFISESLKDGFLPLWNPYVNFGIPQYTDMNSGFWNPITWLIAYLPGYSIYTIQLEVFFYILIGGIGMYALGRFFRWRGDIAVLSAISYMGMGFFVGHLQHLNWVAPAGFLPWCIWAMQLMIKGRSYYYSVLSALLFYMLISSAHPGLIIGAFYFFAFLFSVKVYQEVKNYPDEKGFLFKRVVVFSMLLGLMALGLLYSYTEVLPYVTHSQKPDMGVFSNATTIRSWWSFLFSGITNKGNSFFNNEISLRNCFIGLLPIVFLLYGLRSNWKKIRIWFFLAIFFLYLSSDMMLVDAFRDFLPLVGFVRLNGVFRLFALIAFMIAGLESLNDYIKGASGHQLRLGKYLALPLFLSLLAFLYAIYLLFNQATNTNLFYLFSYFSLSPSGLKRFVEGLDFEFFLLISSLFSFVTLLAIGYVVRMRKWSWLIVIGVVDIFVAVNLQLPYTGLGMQKPNELQAIIDHYPHGIITPQLTYLGENDYGKVQDIDVVGHGSYYNKQPGTLRRASQPIIFKSEFEIFSDSSLNVLKDRPFVFFEVNGNIENVQPKVSYFSPNHVVVNVANKESGDLILLYKKYPHWEVFVNHQSKLKEDSKSIYHKIPLPVATTKENIVSFYFNPILVKIFLLLTVVLLILSMSYLFIFYWKRKSTLSPSILQ